MTATEPDLLDPASPIPLYQQLYLLLRSRIHTGELPPGEKMMGEAELCTAFNVSRITAKRALDELAGNGLVTRRRGRGTVVAKHFLPKPLTSSIDGLFDIVGEMGRNTTVKVLSTTLQLATPEVRARLKLPDGARAMRSQRVRCIGDRAISYLDVWIPEDVSLLLCDENDARIPLLIQLERAGVDVVSATQTIGASAADAVVASALGIPLGVPLIDTRRVVFDSTQRAIEFIKVLYRPELYQYEVNMRRVKKSDGAAWVPGSASVP